MSKFFKIVDAPEVSAPEKRPNEVYRGEGWYITAKEACYTLHYLTGHFVSESKTVTISTEEAEQLAENDLSLIDVLKRYGQY